MRQAKNIQPGSIVQFPHSCFAPYRNGWNGWTFRVAVVDRLYTSKTGKACAEITYCDRIGVDPWDKTVVLDYSEKKIGITIDKLFEVKEIEIDHAIGEDAEFIKRHI